MRTAEQMEQTAGREPAPGHEARARTQQDLKRVTVDTIVKPEGDHLLDRPKMFARGDQGSIGLRGGRKNGVKLRQSSSRCQDRGNVASRYAHAKRSGGIGGRVAHLLTQQLGR